MSKRAVILGLLFAAAIGFLGFFNDMVMHQTFLFSNYMPIFIYGSLLLFVVTINPLLRKIWKSAALSASELALIVAIALPACYVSGRTLIHHFTECLVRPVLNEKVQPGWQKREFIRRTPSRMFAGVVPEYRAEDVLQPAEITKLLFGTSETTEPIFALRSRVPDGGQVPDDAESVSVLLNELIAGEQLLDTDTLAKLTLPSKPKKILETGLRSDEELRMLNRACLDVSLPVGSIRTRQKLEDVAYNKFQEGMAESDEHITVKDIPWYAWIRTLGTFWVPLILSISAAFIGLALVVKRQWAEHEHLPFPITRFASSLLPGEDRKMNSIFRKKSFWIAMGIVAFFHLNNYANIWWPEYTVKIKNSFDFTALSDMFPTFELGGGRTLLRPTFYCTLIGFAFFVSNDVSLSIGIAPFIYALIAGILMKYDVNLNSGGDYNSLRLNNFVKAGSYFGLFMMIVYTGRHFYASVAKQALGFKSTQEVKLHERWGFRVFMIGSMVFAIQLMVVGYEWQWALFQTFIFCSTFFVVSRMVAETGIILIHPMILSVVVLWGFVGTRVLGGQQILLMMIVSIVIDFGCHVGVMPMMVHGLKLADEKPGKTAIWAGVGLTIALCVAIVTALYFQYDRGTSTVGDGWGRRLGTNVFAPVVQIENELEAKGALQQAGTHSGVDWFRNLSPSKAAVSIFVITALLVVGFEVLRLRISKWPFHPIMFLISGFWYAQAVAASFILGWCIKLFVQKYGGRKTYGQLKPIMIGLIAGDMMGGIIITIISFICYWSTGEPPKQFIIFPG